MNSNASSKIIILITLEHEGTPKSGVIKNLLISYTLKLRNYKPISLKLHIKILSLFMKIISETICITDGFCLYRLKHEYQYAGHNIHF